MNTKFLLGALALFLLSGDAFAFHGNKAMASARVQARAYSLFLSGYLSYREGNLDAALEAYRNALKYAENEPEILYEIGNVLVKKGNLAGAKEMMEKALSADDAH
jgi:tetratricopeptide (TPR) repeat protein